MLTELSVLPFCNVPALNVYSVEPAAPVIAVPNVLVTLFAVMVIAAPLTELLTVATVS